ncbi:MAG TPA: multicopper oxidase domain-containing protein [Nostocaceae cyanobacterium]|nr:multicopper oxidase domain-containing protein [Nostocaceae cyanobacterium]
MSKEKLFSRRQLFTLSLGSAGILGVAALWQMRKFKNRFISKIPPQDLQTLNPMQILRDFDYGTLKKENGRTIREFQITARNATIQLHKNEYFAAWILNQRIPGPTLRVKQGERVRVLFFNQGKNRHSLHFHGIHPSEMDGVEAINQGDKTIYEFDALTYGVHLYHCHIEPVTKHIAKGLYGMFIVDPPTPRPPADEIVLVMAGYDVNDDGRNEYYAFNGVPHHYMHHPISIQQNQLIRLYVLNIIEFDPVATFHLHANFFDVYRSGMSLSPSEKTDVITMGTAERHILEFSFRYPGKFMFHPHQDAIAQQGCMGQFEVIPT